MPEQLANQIEIGVVVAQVCSETSAEIVRSEMLEPGKFGAALQRHVEPACGKPLDDHLAMPIDRIEKSSTFRSSRAEPGMNRSTRAGVLEVHGPILPALAVNRYRMSSLRVACDVETARFVAAEASAIE